MDEGLKQDINDFKKDSILSSYIQDIQLYNLIRSGGCSLLEIPTNNIVIPSLNINEPFRIDVYDFHEYDANIKKLKTFDSEKDFKVYKTNLISGCKSASFSPPLILKTPSTYYCLSGQARMLTFMLLGIKPLVRLISSKQEIFQEELSYRRKWYKQKSFSAGFIA